MSTIKDRRIEVDADEALALASKGAMVECVADEGGMMTIWEALGGLTFFAPESALTAFTEPAEPPKHETRTIAHDTPEERTRRILEHVDSTPDEPPTTRQAAMEAELAGEVK